jgi:branched-subunit amino acid aminotransferase/4-amino-4-deoxychorismate lyase
VSAEAAAPLPAKPAADDPRDVGPRLREAPARPEVVLLDGELVPAGEACVNVFDRGLLYGESLFETVKVVDEAPCLWEGHRDRLAAGCRELGLPLDVEALEAGLRRLLAVSPVAHGALRLQVTGGVQPGGGRGMTAPREGRRPRLVAAVFPTAPYPAALYSGGAAVVSAMGLARPLPQLKSGSYLASVAAKARAEEAGAFEALFVRGDPAEVLEGSFSNILFWDGSCLLTPPPDRALPGVALSVVKEVAASLELAVREEPVLLERLRTGGLLLTGSLVGVCSCASLDGEALLPLRDLATRLQDGLRLREEESVARWQASEGGPRERC